jgi:DNA-binding PadR family transcriptional regulator
MRCEAVDTMDKRYALSEIGRAELREALQTMAVELQELSDMCVDGTQVAHGQMMIEPARDGGAAAAVLAARAGQGVELRAA